jgi:hypothetical protein
MGIRHGDDAHHRGYGKAWAGSIPRAGIGAGRAFQKIMVVLRRRRSIGQHRALYGRGHRRTPHAAAQAMLDAFASVGADRFDVTWTNSAGDPRRYHEGVGLADLIRRMPAKLDRATRHRRNLIVRPHGPGVTFLQLAANGRATPSVSTARRSTARKTAPTAAARILCGA